MSDAGVHTPLPTDPGERVVADALNEAQDDSWHLWFGLQRGAMRELDALVIAPDLGCFCIEVKDYEFSSVLEYGDDDIVTGSGSHRHPLKQAQQAMYGLMTHLTECGIDARNKPYFYVTAAFPRIERDQIYAFGEEFSRHFEGMLFADDLGDSQALRERLLKVGQSPPIGSARTHHRPRPAQVEAVTAILTRRASKRHRPIPEDLRRKFAANYELARTASPVIKKGPVRAEDRRRALRVPGASRRNGISRVVFHGRPGTGKTTELVQVAQSHALAGRATLVCCFNKVLAADLRVRIASLPSFDGARENLLITHLGALPARREGADDHDDRPVGLDVFKTVCVDEAQDVEQTDFDRLMILAPNAEWFLSDSPAQALYGNRSQFLEQAVETARLNQTWETMRFNRRSGIAERLVADAALELSPNQEGIDEWVTDHPVKMRGDRRDAAQEALDLDMPPEPRGHFPELVRLRSRDAFYPRADEYARIIDDEVGRLRAGDDLDLAVVFFRKDFTELKRMKHALKQLELPFLDQVEAGSRGRALERGVVRIVTVHSMRGVDAARVLLVGIEQLDSFSESQSALLNIALSRGREGMRIVLRPIDAQPGSHRAFLERLVASYERS